MGVPTVSLLTLQYVTTGTNQLPFRPDAKKHRLWRMEGWVAGTPMISVEKKVGFCKVRNKRRKKEKRNTMVQSPRWRI